MGNDLEGSQTPGAGTASTNLPGGGDQRPSIDAEAIVKALKESPELAEFIRSEAAKGVQSDKDRRLNKMERKFGDFEEAVEVYKSLKGKGLSDEDALWRMKVEAAISGGQVQPQGTVSSVQSPGLGGTKPKTAAEVEALELLKEAGLDQDPRATAFLRERGNAPDLVNQASRFIISTLRGVKPANPATVIQPSGGVTSTPGDDVEALTKRMEVLLRDPRNNKAEIEKLNKELGGRLPK